MHLVCCRWRCGSRRTRSQGWKCGSSSKRFKPLGTRAWIKQSSLLGQGVAIFIKENLTFTLNFSGRQCWRLLPSWAQEVSGVGWGGCFTGRSTRGCNKYLTFTPSDLNSAPKFPQKCWLLKPCYRSPQTIKLVIEFCLLPPGSGETVEWCWEKEARNWWGALAPSSHYRLQTSANQPVQVGHDNLSLVTTGIILGTLMCMCMQWLSALWVTVLSRWMSHFTESTQKVGLPNIC